MEILRSDEGRACVLRVIGDFDATSAEAFDAQVQTAIDEERLHVVADTEQLRVLDSSALAAMIRADKRLQQLGGRLAVAALPAFAARMFTVLGLDRRFALFDTVADAVRHVSSESGS